MFERVDVVKRTAFFRRTSAPTFDPLGDRWTDQPYNASRFPVETRAGGTTWTRYGPPLVD